MIVIGHLKHNVAGNHKLLLKSAKRFPKHGQKFLSVLLQHLLKGSLAMQERFSILKGVHWSPKPIELCLHNVNSDYG